MDGWVTVRTAGDPAALTEAVRKAVRAIDPTIAVAHVATMAERRAEAVAGERFRGVVVVVFATVALVLATLGLYGVVAAGVNRRRREIGIRMALGETSERVRRRVLAGAGILCLTGVAVGGGGATMAERALRAFLVPGVESGLLVFVAVSATLVAVALVAAFVPARRASRVDPAIALRDST